MNDNDEDDDDVLDVLAAKTYLFGLAYGHARGCKIDRQFDKTQLW